MTTASALVAVVALLGASIAAALRWAERQEERFVEVTHEPGEGET